MCSLFLQPESALLFNAYEESRTVWGSYTMLPAAQRLASLLYVTHRAGAGQADIAGWHKVFDPVNRFGLVLINSSGSPTEFIVNGGWGSTADIPPSGRQSWRRFTATQPPTQPIQTRSPALAGQRRIRLLWCRE